MAKVPRGCKRTKKSRNGSGASTKSSGAKSSSKNSITQKFGKQGKPRTMQQALNDVNPNYNKGKEYKINCQRCAPTYEMQRRGYDVEALPYITKGKDKYASQWQHTFKNQKWDGNLGNRNAVVKKNIENKMKGYGDNSRAIVYVEWKSGSAHVFNVEQIKGKTQAVDAQVGTKINLFDYLKDSKPSRTMISRVDNLDINENVMIGMCKKR